MPPLPTGRFAAWSGAELPPSSPVDPSGWIVQELFRRRARLARFLTDLALTLPRPARR